MSGGPESGGRGLKVRSRTPVAVLTLAELRVLDPELLTLDEAVAIAGRRLGLLLDIKDEAVAPLLGGWLRRRRDAAEFAVCTESIPALMEIRDLAPRAERWPSLPDLGSGRRQHVPMVLADLWRTHRQPHLARRSLIELQRTLCETRGWPQGSLAGLAGLPWRTRLPQELARRSHDVGAAGFCVQHWLVTWELCAAARQLRLPITAWTINHPSVARMVIDCGIDLITTDQVVRLRRALEPTMTQDPPRLAIAPA